ESAGGRTPGPGDATPVGSFEDQLRYAGQTLDHYLAADDRQLVMRFRGWPHSDVIGERVDHVVLWGRRERSMSVAPPANEASDSVVVPFPQLSCGESIAYQVVGDLSYRNDIRVLGGPSDGECSAGVVCLRSPHSLLTEAFTVGIAASGGEYYP